jgi:threonine synthase
VDRDATVVCVLTGHGLKDPETAERTAGGAGVIIESAPTTAGVMRALGW